jgi:hypothetical protein
MTEGVWSAWPERWSEVLAACKRLGGQVQPLVVKPPASRNSITGVEDDLGVRLPSAVRIVLRSFSREFGSGWNLPVAVHHPPNVREVRWGGFTFGLHDIARAERARRSWVESCFRNPNDAYDAIWHEKVGLLSVPNGDVVAADVSQDPAPIVYLSHDDGGGHGLVLGWDFIDFLDRWSSIGSPGPEDWVWLPFHNAAENTLDPAGANATAWREWLGVSW